MKNLKSVFILSAFLAATGIAYSATPAAISAATPATPAAAAAMPMAAAADMTAGEVRKVDLENKKVTIKHAEIKNLDMPGMTMVFQVKDAAVLAQIKAGDKILFKAEKSAGALVVTELKAAK